MSDNFPPFAPDRNPLTYANHRRESLRQITLPLVIGGIIFLVLLGLVIWSTWGPSASGEHNRWMGVSLIWLILPTLLFALIFLALMVGLIYLVTMAYIKLPPLARKVQNFFLLVKYQVAHLDDRIIAPVLKFHSFKASIQKFGRSLRRKN